MSQVSPPTSLHSAKSALSLLTLSALGVVYGDIGTSPLYAFKEAFGRAGGLPMNEANVLAILSMMFWSIMVLVSVKYVIVMLRFDNEGEGGILALLALSTRLTRKNVRLAWFASICGIFGASLFFGDAVITPAISVLSAVEGVSVATPALEQWVIPVTVVVITCLFWIQSRGTGAVGKVFGPVMAVWFCMLGLLGALSIAKTPEVLGALDPSHAFFFVVQYPGLSFVILGAVFLALTGGEALYADMGHFGKRPIRIAWFSLVFPALTLNYLGQGALVLRDPEAIRNPFYLLAPDDLLWPMVILSTMATVIASQATISGAFSVARQATRLGFLPRLPTRHTSESEEGQIYIAQLNWAMLIIVLGVVFIFRNSSAIASAYGIAVAGTMLLDTVLVSIVIWSTKSSGKLPWLTGLAALGMLELTFFAANSTKFMEGGWFPVACGLIVFTALSTWKRAGMVLQAAERNNRLTIDQYMTLFGPEIPRVPGTAVYLSPDPEAIPTTLLHNLKHNKILHERVILLHIADADVPRLDDKDRIEVQIIDPHRVYQITIRYGFMEEPDVPNGLKLLERHAVPIEPMDTTYFLGRTTIAPAARRTLFSWRRELFRFMQRNSPAAAEYYQLAPERVIELGTRLTI